MKISTFATIKRLTLWRRLPFAHNMHVRALQLCDVTLFLEFYSGGIFFLACQPFMCVNVDNKSKRKTVSCYCRVICLLGCVCVCVECAQIEKFHNFQRGNEYYWDSREQVSEKCFFSFLAGTLFFPRRRAGYTCHTVFTPCRLSLLKHAHHYADGRERRRPYLLKCTASPCLTEHRNEMHNS